MTTLGLSTDPVPRALPADGCPNCDAPRIGPYCPACGQHHLDDPLRLRNIVRDFVARQLALEGGVLRTFVEMTVRPGGMIRDYLAGRRQRYTNPVGYLVLSAGLYVLTLPLWIDRLRDESRAAVGAESADVDRYMELLTSLMSYPLAMSLLMLVFFIPALRGVFRGRIDTVGACVFSLYTFAHYNLLYTLSAPLVAAGTTATGALSSVSMLLWTVVLLVAGGGFFGVRLSTFLRTLAAAAVSMIGMSAAFMVIYLLGRAAGLLPPAA